MRFIVPALALAAAACATSPQPAPGSEPACAAITFPPNPQFAAWSVDKFAGLYNSGGQTLTVRREGNSLWVQERGRAPRQITTDDLNSWRFRDGCRVEYRFFLPPDGPGARLEIHDPANRPFHSEWQRVAPS